MFQRIAKPFRISIHALLAESDIRNTPALLGNQQFLSTLSLRRATDDILAGVNELLISIHALLAESDWWLRCWKLAARDISIHALLAESDSKSAQNSGALLRI